VSVIDEPVKVEMGATPSSSGWFGTGFGVNSSKSNEKLEKNGNRALIYRLLTHSFTRNHSKIADDFDVYVGDTE